MTRFRPAWCRANAMACALLLVLLTQLLGRSDVAQSVTDVPYAGTNYYAPTPPGCPFYSTWTRPCYSDARQRIDEDVRFLEANGGGNFQRVWVSLDQLFDCFDPVTGFCGYDEVALGNVVDSLHLMAQYDQRVVLVLFAQSNRASDVNYFRVRALDGRHEQMKANYVQAAAQFVERIAADPTAASVVAVIDMQNEGFFHNREGLLLHGSVCGDDGGCIDRQLTKPFFEELYATLKFVAPQFLYTVSALQGELLGEEFDYWVDMYPVDIYDVHLYVSEPQDRTALFARATELPKPWFAGEVGTSNPGDGSKPCWTYDGNDPCTVATNTWWRKHLGPDYGALAVLIENRGTVFQYSDGVPVFTRTGSALSRPN